MGIKKIGLVLTFPLLPLLTFSSSNTTDATVQNTDVFNNPFLAKQVENLIKEAVNKIVKEEVGNLKREYKLKYEQQIMQLQLRNLEMKKQILNLKKEIEKLKDDLAKEKGQGQSERKITLVRLKGVIGAGNTAILITEDGKSLKKGDKLGNYTIIGIDTAKQKIIVKDDKGNIRVIPYIIENE